ncbi:unnamed protein product [Gadus morhua 'NCC']
MDPHGPHGPPMDPHGPHGPPTDPPRTPHGPPWTPTDPPQTPTDPTDPTGPPTDPHGPHGPPTACVPREIAPKALAQGVRPVQTQCRLRGRRRAFITARRPRSAAPSSHRRAAN